MRHFATALAILVVVALSTTQAAVYIGGGCYDCNPPNGQAPGVYTANGGGRGGGGGYQSGGGGGYPSGGGGGGGYVGTVNGRPTYSGNFGPNGYNGGGTARYSGGGGGGGYSGERELTQYIGGGGGRGGGLVQTIRG